MSKPYKNKVLYAAKINDDASDSSEEEVSTPFAAFSADSSSISDSSLQTQQKSMKKASMTRSRSLSIEKDSKPMEDAPKATSSSLSIEKDSKLSVPHRETLLTVDDATDDSDASARSDQIDEFNQKLERMQKLSKMHRQSQLEKVQSKIKLAKARKSRSVKGQRKSQLEKKKKISYSMITVKVNEEEELSAKPLPKVSKKELSFDPADLESHHFDDPVDSFSKRKKSRQRSTFRISKQLLAYNPDKVKSRAFDAPQFPEEPWVDDEVEEEKKQKAMAKRKALAKDLKKIKKKREMQQSGYLISSNCKMYNHLALIKCGVFFEGLVIDSMNFYSYNKLWYTFEQIDSNNFQLTSRYGIMFGRNCSPLVRPKIISLQEMEQQLEANFKMPTMMDLKVSDTFVMTINLNAFVDFLKKMF